MSLTLFFTINYDLGVNQGAHIFPNGVCSSSDKLVDHTLSIVSTVNKSFQMVMFVVYLYYRYQLNKDVQNATILSSWERVLHKIAIGMGATIGMSQGLYLLFVIFESPLIFSMSLLMFFIEQCVVMTAFLSTKKMKKMCKERFSKEWLRLSQYYINCTVEYTYTVYIYQCISAEKFSVCLSTVYAIWKINLN